MFVQIFQARVMWKLAGSSLHQLGLESVKGSLQRDLFSVQEIPVLEPHMH